MTTACAVPIDTVDDGDGNAEDILCGKPAIVRIHDVPMCADCVEEIDDTNPECEALKNAPRVPIGSCRRCSECLGQEHHWLENGVPLSDDCPHGEPMSTDCDTCIHDAPDFVCKHCDATRAMTEDDL